MRYTVEQAVSLTEAARLYETNGWTNYTVRPDMLRQALAQSLWLLTARTDDGELVGLLRAVGDGASIVFIQDILVLPHWQRQGIGTALLQRTIERFKQVYQLQLTTDDSEQTKAFYRANGFVPLSDWCCVSFIYAPNSSTD